MKKNTNDWSTAETFNKLKASPEYSQYTLRSLFFYRKLREIRTLKVLLEIEQLMKVKESFVWKEFLKWGISKEAWQVIDNKGIAPLRVFAHPRLLMEQPRILYYYRGIALISQKGLQACVGVNISKIERGGLQELNSGVTNKLVLSLNGLISTIILASDSIQESYFNIFFCTTTGAQIQGSWVNEIGESGMTAVKEIFIKELRDYIEQFVFKDDSSQSCDEEGYTLAMDNIRMIKVVRFIKGYHVLFKSEPDISFRDVDDKPLISVEIKAGIDPAAALERLGAAIKSLNNEKSLNPSVKTVYVGGCITAEVKKRIDQMSPFNYTFTFGEILNDHKSQKRFIGLFATFLVE